MRKKIGVEFQDAPSQNYSLEYQNEDDVLYHIKGGHRVNILVTMGSTIVLSMDSHIEIQRSRGLSDDEILLEGLVEYRYGKLYIDSDFHGLTKFAEKELPQIEEKLNQEVLPEVRRAA